MPTKHIDAEQWAQIEALTVELTQERNTPIKEGEVLKTVIAAGLEATSIELLKSNFAFNPRYGVFIVRKGEQEQDEETTLNHPWTHTPTESEKLADLLAEGGDSPFIVCVYGKTNTGRTTFATKLYKELNGRGRDTEYFDDSDRSDIAQAWRLYRTGKSVIIVLHAPDYLRAGEMLYSQHIIFRNVDSDERLTFDDFLHRVAAHKWPPLGE